MDDALPLTHPLGTRLVKKSAGAHAGVSRQWFRTPRSTNSNGQRATRGTHLEGTCCGRWAGPALERWFWRRVTLHWSSGHVRGRVETSVGFVCRERNSCSRCREFFSHYGSDELRSCSAHEELQVSGESQGSGLTKHSRWCGRRVESARQFFLRRKRAQSVARSCLGLTGVPFAKI